MVGTRLREGHYGQRPCAPHQQVEHMAAPTKAHCIKKTLANGEPSTHGAFQKSPRMSSMSEFGYLADTTWTVTHFVF